MNFKYTITKFDAENKLVVVTFDDGNWAELRLTNPLPKDITELEAQIKRFTAPKEAIEARLAPDADLSYIESLVGIEKECERFSFKPPEQAEQTVDPEVEAQMKMFEESMFQNKVKEALVSLGVLTANTETPQ